MSSPLLRWSVLAFACLWFGMLVPVHQRGQIQLPGGRADAASAVHCKGADGHCNKKTKPAGKQDGTPKGRENCAVCHFVAGLHAPPPVTAVEARLGLVRDMPAEHAVVVMLRHAALPFHGLDPPAA
jgi:hypothetical protein